MPLDGTPQTARALEHALAVAARGDVEIILLHVTENGAIPAFSDQVQHETDAFGDEFIARYACSTRLCATQAAHRSTGRPRA
jgi:nucleotide-binding universal stress UspA family protein